MKTALCGTGVDVIPVAPVNPITDNYMAGFRVMYKLYALIISDCKLCIGYLILATPNAISLMSPCVVSLFWLVFLCFYDVESNLCGFKDAK